MREVPLPVPTPISAPFWAQARRHRLVVQQCGSCQRMRHYPQELCPRCQSPEVVWATLGGTGHIYTFTVTHQAFHPSRHGRVPYVVATVELDEGIRMVSDLDEPPERVRIGARVEVFFERLDEQITLPRFRLLAGTDEP